MSRELASHDGQTGFCTSFAHAIKDHVVARGGDPVPVLEAMAGASGHSAVEHRRRRVTAEQLKAGLKWASLRFGDEHVGLHAGMQMLPSRMGALGYAVMTAPRGYEGLQLFEALQRLVMSEMAVVHEGKGALVRACHQSRATLPDDYLFWSFMLACRLNLTRAACGRHVVPERVELPCAPPQDVAPLRFFVGGPVKFGASHFNEWLRQGCLNEPNPHSKPEIHLVMSAMAKRQWSETFEGDDALVVHLKRAVMEVLGKGDVPTLGALAPRVSSMSARGCVITARQLQRRLASQDCSFRDLVADVRRERALAQLRATDRSLAEIAAEAGYAELSSFHRAVRRWTGLTPMKIREDGLDIGKV